MDHDSLPDDKTVHDIFTEGVLHGQRIQQEREAEKCAIAYMEGYTAALEEAKKSIVSLLNDKILIQEATTKRKMERGVYSSASQDDDDDWPESWNLSATKKGKNEGKE